MAAKSEQSSKSSSKKKSGGGGGGSSSLRSVMSGAVGADTLLDLVERLGLVDVVLGRVKSRIEETDLDELLDEITDYLRRNPEVLVVSLGAVTIATGLLVWLNNRREWDGAERRGSGSRTTSSPGKVRRTTRAKAEDDDDEDDDE